MKYRFSIITPCSRVYNLPIILESIKNSDVRLLQWIIVFDLDCVDDRILQYNEGSNIDIVLDYVKGGALGYKQRNKALEHVQGEYIYFLDDDNLLHNKILSESTRFLDDRTILIYNQFNQFLSKRFNELNEDILRPNKIDTAQFVVPFNKTEWINNKRHEYYYIEDLVTQGCKIKFIDRCYSYRNYLRKQNGIRTI